MNKPRYKAFISYSHRDERWARWLQRSLERYRVPRRLVGKQGAHGPVPARLRPVFRDREDLSSASDLTSSIKEELGKSEFLVVICSPDAAGSHWVNEEIRYFRDSGRQDRVLALIVDGDPQAETVEEGCFPEALLESPDGTSREPLAADVRRYGDGKQLSLLKIIAGLLGVRLDELRRRDAHRRLQRRLVWGCVTVVVVSVLGWLLYSQAASRAAAQVQRANTEELLSYMLGDLQRLDSVTGVEIMAVEHAQQAQRSAQLGLANLESEALFEQVMTWREDGLDLEWEGKLEAAMEQFRNSYAALVELHSREGNTDRVLFELGQAEFYLGEVYVSMGEPRTAREHWIRYGALTRRLLNRQPNNPRYVMELSYTLMNLGALESVMPVPDSDKALELLQAALQYNQMALVLDPGNPEYLDSLPTQLAWLADTRVMKCSLGEALELRQETVDLRRVHVVQEANAYNQQLLAYALTGLAGVQQQIGLGEEAVASFLEATGILRLMQEAEPENEEIESELLYRETRLAHQLISMGEVERANSVAEPIAAQVAELGGGPDLQSSVELAEFGAVYASVLFARGEDAAGEQALRSSLSQLTALVREKPDAMGAVRALARTTFAYWEHFGEWPGDASTLLPADLVPGHDLVESCQDAYLGARLAVPRDELELARSYVDYALSKGYFEPSFITFCKRYGLCELP